MKTLLTLTFIFTLFLGFHSVQAKVIIVNNNTGQPTVQENYYDNLQVAINDSESGDIIYVVGSPESYGEVTILNNSLTIIGPGYFLGENDNVKNENTDEIINTQATDETAKIFRLSIRGDKSSNTVITGMDFSEAYNSYISIGNINENQNKPENVVIQRNKITTLSITYAVSTIVKENYIDNVQLNRGANNSLIWNNIITSRIQEAYNSLGLSGNYIKNNTLNNGLSGVNNAKVENNIFISGGLAGCENNTVQHNIFTIDETKAFPEDPNSNTYKEKGNEFTQPLSALFITEKRNIDSDYQLKNDSPAKKAGIDEIDTGAFVEQDPDNSYKISGLPAYPAIYELKTNGVGTANDGMKVTIKAKSHN